MSTATPIPGSSPSGRTETTTIKVRFDVFEAEEFVGDELSKVRGILSLVVTQTEITVTYDPQLISRAEIIKELKQNPNVRVEEP